MSGVSGYLGLGRPEQRKKNYYARYGTVEKSYAGGLAVRVPSRGRSGKTN